MQCKVCGEYVPNVGEQAIAVKCSRCVSLTMGNKFPPVDKGYQPTGRPVGWHFMKEFVDKDGKVFHRGKEQPKLKGTLPLTKVKPRKKTKRRTREQILIDRHNKKKVVLRKARKKKTKAVNERTETAD